MRSRPGAHHKSTRRLVRAQQLELTAQALEALLAHRKRKRRVDHAGGQFRVGHHGRGARAGAACQLDTVVTVFQQAVVLENFFGCQRISGARRIDRQQLAAQIIKALDFSAHHQLIHAGITAAHNRHVMSGLCHGHGVVYSGMRDLKQAGRQPGALLVRIRRVLHLDAQTAADKVAGLHGRQQGQVAGGVEDIHAQQHGLA